MAQQFLFVPTARPGDTKKQKELRYAAAKAHITRNVHRRRRQDQLRGGGAKALSEFESTSLRSTPIVSRTDVYTIALFRPGEDKLPVALTEAALNLPLGLPPLLCGNSDPFACQLVQVNPIVNQAASFVRFHLTRSWSPSFMLRLVPNSTRYCPLLDGYGSLVGLSAANWLWSLLIADVGAFWSAVASVIPFMTPLLGEKSAFDMHKVTLQLKAQSLAHIRQAMTNVDSASELSMVLVYHVKALFREACMSRDLEAARFHAKMLRNFTEQQPVCEDPQSLRVTLWSDAMSALLQFRRPVFDHSEWMPHILATAWQSAETILPSLISACTSLPDSIINPALRAAFLHIRRAIYICSIPIDTRRQEQMRRAETIFHWMTSKVEYHMSRLLNLYFNLISTDVALCYPVSPGQRHTAAATSLALLHVLQRSFCDITQSTGIDVHESAGVLHPHLMHMMKLAVRYCSCEEKIAFGEEHLWIVFVGTYCEERIWLHSRQSRSDTDVANSLGQPYRWFHNELSKLALRMGLEKWSDVKPVLSRFVLNEMLEPKAKLWYEMTVMGGMQRG